MRRLLALATLAVLASQAGVATASTAETQARLAAARPVATQAVAPPDPVSPHRPIARREAVAGAPATNLPSPEAPAPKPPLRRNLDVILLLPTLLVLVALVRWFARRRRLGSKRV